MDQITETLLKEFVREHEISGVSQSKQFEHFASYAIIRKEHPAIFNTHDVVVGDDDQVNGSDLGIDGLAIVVNGRLIVDTDELQENIDRTDAWEVTFLFVQAETSSSFDTGKVQKTGFGVREFFKQGKTARLKKNAAIADLAEIREYLYANSRKFIKRNPLCKIFYVTTGRLKDDDIAMNAHMRDVEERLMDTGLLESVTFECVGADGIQKLYHRTRHAAKAGFTFDKKLTIAPIQGVQQAFCGYLPWPEYAKIITDESGHINDALFVDNIRAWGGYNEVNIELSKTLQSDERARFVLMNNGVTVIAKEIKQTGDEFQITDYQIVNGCQTSHVLFERRDNLDATVSVPFRLIGTAEDSIKTSIITATNRQTPIKPLQLFALEEFPKILEQYFGSFDGARRLYFERRSRQYERISVERTRIINIADMIRVFAAMFLNEPHRTTRNFKGLTDKVGKEIFRKGQRMEPYYTAAYALYQVVAMLRRGRLGREFNPAKFHILMALRVMIAGYEMPKLTANRAAAYCKKIDDVLANPTQSEVAITKAAELVRSAGGNLHRDDIRTDGFTKRVIGALVK